MKKFKSGKLWAIVCALMACVLVFSMTACGGGEGDNDKLTLNTATAQVEVGKTTSLSVTSAETEDIIWSVDKTDVATVKGSGAGNKLCTVTGVKEGTATITAKAGDKTATCALTVKAAGQGGGEITDPSAETVTIKLNGKAVGTEVQYLHVDEAVTYTAEASKGSAITWESSATDVATVSGGKVTPKKAGEATITAKVSDSVKATVKVNVGAPTEIQFNDNPVDGWSYWEGIRYGGNGDGHVTKAVYYENDNSVSITYTATSANVPYTVQLRYNSAEYTGTSNDVTLTVVAPKAGKMHVNGEDVAVKVGENVITVENFVEQGLYVQFGSKSDNTMITGENLTFVLKNITFKSNVKLDLVAPSFAIDSDTKIITITDGTNDKANVEKYELGFFANAEATSPSAIVTVTDNSEVDISTVASGTYVVKIRAVNNDVTIRNSAWSAESAQFIVENAKSPLKDNSNVIKGSWVYYSQGGAGAFSEAYTDADGNLHVENYTAQGINEWWGFQLIYRPEEGKTITGATFTVTSDQNGFITVAQENANNVFELTETEEGSGSYVSSVSVSGLNISGDGTFIIWLCKLTDANNRLLGNITISDIQFTYAS